MLELLTGAGLASSAGLNAYVPLLLVGLIARYTSLLELSAGWQWLENPVVLVVLGVLLAVELAADKIPVLDSANDVLQTFVRPTSGGITFGAGATAVTPESITGDDGSWAPVVAGVLIALVFHTAKALARPVLNAVTAGVGAPVVSTLEDIASTIVAVLAILVPIIVVIVVPLLAALLIWALRRRRRRKRDKVEAEADRFGSTGSQ